MILGEQLGSSKGAAKSAPPELQEILPLMLTFLDSRSWCGCLRASHTAHDAVRALFSGLMPDGTRPEEGWTGAIHGGCFVYVRVCLKLCIDFYTDSLGFVS